MKGNSIDKKMYKDYESYGLRKKFHQVQHNSGELLSKKQYYWNEWVNTRAWGMRFCAQQKLQ